MGGEENFGWIKIWIRIYIQIRQSTTWGEGGEERQLVQDLDLDSAQKAWKCDDGVDKE